MTFSNFSQLLSELESTASRLEMMKLLAQLFEQLQPAETKEVCYLVQGSLVPAYKSLEFQMSAKMVIRALARVPEASETLGAAGVEAPMANTLFGEVDFSAREKHLMTEYKKLGDIGILAEQVCQKSKNSELEILEVYGILKEIALESGQGSQERKVAGLANLFQKSDAVSSRFIARIVVGKLRLGFSTMTILDALSWSVTESKSEASLLENAYQKKADVGELAVAYLSTKNDSVEQRTETLNGYSVEVGVPVMPALCQRLESADEVVAKMGEVYVEPKYDGLRVQIHISPTQIHAFTRNLEDISHMFPELESARSILKVDSVILDAEAIGYNKETGQLLPFQQTITRRRKHEVTAQADKVPIRFYVFDVLKVGQKDVLQEKLRDRKDLLKDLFGENELFLAASATLTKDPNVIRSLHGQYLGDGLEGIVVKQVESDYGSGRKGWQWVKLKEAEGKTGKLNDTLDCVVMGYYSGRGKRAIFGMGAVLVGVRNDNAQGDDPLFVTVAKIGTGLSEDQLVSIKKDLDALAVAEQPVEYKVPKILIPDVWVKPEMVLEIAADELTKSPNHTAGVALRFPRLIKVRTDKSVEQATSVSELKGFS